jgi:alanine racemase
MSRNCSGLRRRRRRAAGLRVWLKIDSGMHRLGFAPERWPRCMRARGDAGIDPEIGLMTHFSDSEVFDGTQTPLQMACFSEATKDLRGSALAVQFRAVLGWPDARADWVRTGGLLYGLSVVDGKTGADFGFRPAMTLSTR